MKKKFQHSDAFLNALKNVTKMVPCSQTDSQALEVVKSAVKESGISVKEVLDYIKALCKISTSYTDKERKNFIKYHIDYNYKGIGNALSMFKSVSEEQFSAIATLYQMDASVLMDDKKVQEYGWLKVLDALKVECKSIKLTEDVKCTETVLGTPAMGIETKTKKVIVMKDAHGNSVAEFQTSKEASEKTSICACSIRKSLGNHPGYQHLLSKEDGKYYSFEYKEISVTAPVKTTSRKYSFSKIVVLNKKTNEAHTYENAGKAADAIGVNKERIYYRAMKAANHSEGNYEFWKESEYVSMAKVA